MVTVIDILFAGFQERAAARRHDLLQKGYSHDQIDRMFPRRTLKEFRENWDRILANRNESLARVIEHECRPNGYHEDKARFVSELAALSSEACS